MTSRSRRARSVLTTNPFLRHCRTILALAASNAILRLECGSQKRDQLPAVYVFVRSLAGAVVAARQHDYLVVEFVALEFRYDLAGEFRQESHIVFRIHDERLLRIACVLRKIRHRADCGPEFAQALHINLRFESRAYVPRGLSVPYDIRKISGSVIESSHPNTRIVRRRQKRVTRAQARAHNAEAIEALLLEPIEAAADVHYALPYRIQRAANIGGNGIVSAANFWGHANVMVGHAQPQHRNSHQVH